MPVGGLIMLIFTLILMVRKTRDFELTSIFAMVIDKTVGTISVNHVFSANANDTI